MTGLAIIVLAAGSARRMRGRDKLMETINGTPLIARQLGRAIAALPAGHTGAMVVLADMPDSTTDDLNTLRDAFDADPRAIIRATSNGVQGHPVVFPADLFPDLIAITGDTGAKPVIMAQRDRLHLIPLPEGHATTDLDTPEAWDDWRTRTNTPN
jgi:CTP:molybdopterin cytidylyltransferase MocA